LELSASPAPDGTVPDLAIDARDLFHVYRDGDVETIVLRGVDLAIGSGEWVAVTGRSGSGKSTLLNLIAGSDRPTAGSIRVAGVEIAGADEAVRARLRGRTVGILYQSGNLVPFLDARENVRLAAQLGGREIPDADALELLRAVGVEDRARHRPGELSGGEQQRVGLACIVAAEPAIILADEMTGELDTRSAGQVLDLVEAVHGGSNATIVMVTHDPAIAARADRIVELRDGIVVGNAS
jgi:ABC-type lipoprotein export system ATPase subunit